MPTTDAAPAVLTDPRRLAAVAGTELTAAPPDPAFDRLARVAAGLARAPVAVLSLLTGDRQLVLGQTGWPGRRDFPAAEFACRHVVETETELIIPDARPGHPVGTGLAGVGARAYAGLPVVLGSGFTVGTLCVLDPAGRDWDAATLAGLRDVAAAAAAQIEWRAAAAGRRRTEERVRLLESVVVHANDAVLVTDAEPIDGVGPKVIFVNEAFTRMTGYAPADIIGKTPRILQGPKTDRAQLDKIRRALTKWRPVQVELVNNHKDGTEFWVELSIVPVADGRGWYTHWVSVQRDITARKRAEAELRQAKEAADAANQAKSVFLSRMSHELRTPLNAVLGFGQLLEMDDLTADQRENADQIRKGGRHLLDLINEVLEIARVETGELRLTLEPVSVARVAGEVLSLIQPLADQAGVRLSRRAGAADQAVVADPQRLKQILLNLLANAVKYNRPGGAADVGWGCGLDGVVRVTVTDTGVGIAAGLMPRLFTPFDRLGAEQRAVEGSGLGLALSKRLAEAMNGALGAASVEGKGSTFWLDLPAATPADDIPSGRHAQPGSAADFSLGGTVLYVEDNLANLRLVERILSRRPGVRLLSAMQGRVGWDLARQHQPDLILLDLHLPDLPGDAVLDLVRSDPRTAGTPVVILSADATPRQVDRLLAAGANHYLTKPLDIAKFLRVVDAALKPVSEGVYAGRT